MRPSLIVLATALAAALAAPAALAQKKERDAASPASELSEVGKGGHLAREPLKPGAYISQRHRQAAQAWMAKNRAPSGGQAADWKIGQSLERGARVQPLPAGLKATLPAAPPGNQYVLLGSDVLLIASSSRIVVDAVAAGAKP